MKNVFEYLARRPQTRLALLRIVFYLASAYLAKEALNLDTIFILVGALAGLGDLAGTTQANGKSTPVNDPKLGAGREMPPALRAAALAVSGLLPGPIPELFEKYGVDGMWALVKAAENGLKQPLTSEQLKASRDAELKKRAAQ